MIRFHLVTPPVGWTARKAHMMTQELSLVLAQNGVPNVQIHIEDVGGSDMSPMRRADLILRCNKCPEAKWTAPMFSPCPECGGRTTVRKITKQEAEAESVSGIKVKVHEKPIDLSGGKTLDVGNIGRPPAPLKRGPGRPKGSKNRKKKARGRRAKQREALPPLPPIESVT